MHKGEHASSPGVLYFHSIMFSSLLLLHHSFLGRSDLQFAIPIREVQPHPRREHKSLVLEHLASSSSYKRQISLSRTLD